MGLIPHISSLCDKQSEASPGPSFRFFSSVKTLIQLGVKKHFLPPKPHAIPVQRFVGPGALTNSIDHLTGSKQLAPNWKPCHLLRSRRSSVIPRAQKVRILTVYNRSYKKPESLLFQRWGTDEQIESVSLKGNHKHMVWISPEGRDQITHCTGLFVYLKAVNSVTYSTVWFIL